MNKYHTFILQELLHWYERYKKTDKRIRPGIYWDETQYKFLREAFTELQEKKLISLKYGSCCNCGKRCGHLYVHLTDNGLLKAKEGP